MYSNPIDGPMRADLLFCNRRGDTGTSPRTTRSIRNRPAARYIISLSIITRSYHPPSTSRNTLLQRVSYVPQKNPSRLPNFNDSLRLRHSCRFLLIQPKMRQTLNCRSLISSRIVQDKRTPFSVINRPASMGVLSTPSDAARSRYCAHLTDPDRRHKARRRALPQLSR